MATTARATTARATTGARDGDVHVWERFGLWDGLFAGALAVPTVVALARVDVPIEERLVTLGLAAALGGLYALVAFRRDRLAEGSWPYLAFYLVAVGLTAVLIPREPTYFLLFFGLYPHAFLFLGRWWPVGILLLATTPYVRDDGLQGVLAPSNLAGLLGNVALAGVMGVFITRIADQSEQRRDALDALERARAELAASERTAGILSERQRLAREIHDTLAQGFTSIVMHLEAAEQALGDTAPTAQRHLDAARRTARRSLTEVRRSVAALRPSPLDGATLAEALARVADQEQRESGVTTTVHTHGEPLPLAPDVEVTLVRVAQEALANVRRHAAASRADVTLSYMDDVVTLDVRDDGRGFSSGPVRDGGGGPRGGGGYGLVALRERLGALGGRLEVESVPGAGTTLAATVPARPLTAAAPHEVAS